MNAPDCWPSLRSCRAVLRCGGNHLKLAATLGLALLIAACASLNSSTATLRFSAPEGRALNEFFRQGSVAAHLVLTSGSAPRLVVAFPAGNSGAALWFDAQSAPVSWQPDVELVAAHRDLPDGGVLHGVTADIVATGGSITVKQAIASSIRVIRDYQEGGKASPEVVVAPQLSDRSVLGNAAVWTALLATLFRSKWCKARSQAAKRDRSSLPRTRRASCICA